MTDASFGAAGYAILIEDNPNQKFTSIRKSYPPVAYGSKTFPQRRQKSPSTQITFLRFTSLSKSSGIFSGVRRNRSLSQLTIKLSLERKLYPQPCGTFATM